MYKTMKKLLTLIALTILFSSCNSNKKSEKPQKNTLQTSAKVSFEVFNGSVAEDRKKYQSYGLDDTCPNLLDPRISKDKIDKINAAWLDLNKAIGQHLAENNFDWKTEEPYIKAWHKFYFHKDGSLHKYLFNFRGKEISAETKEAYKKVMQEFGKIYKLPLEQDSAFAQCGKAAFKNMKSL